MDPQTLGTRALICVAISWLATSCTTVRNLVDRPFRTPGEHLRTFPDRVWAEYDCDAKELPFFEIEYLELHPRRLAPGEEFGHRMIYVLCPDAPTGVVTGGLHTQILHRGTPIVEDLDSTYDIKPGRWVIDSFVTLPPTAETGVYALRIGFKSRRIQFDRTLTFAVEGEAKPVAERSRTLSPATSIALKTPERDDLRSTARD
jgi:hypothetical protein